MNVINYQIPYGGEIKPSWAAFCYDTPRTIKIHTKVGKVESN